jgi:hypothetical protein
MKALTHQRKISTFIYLSFIAFCSLGIWYGNNLVTPYPMRWVWDWSNILILLIGLPFIFLFEKAVIPQFLEPKVNNRNRFLIPILIGLFFGILDVLIVKFILHPDPYSELPPFLQPFPYSIFLYFSGAFEIEVFYRLIPISLGLFIASKIKSGKYLGPTFWILAVLTAFREPLEQFPSGEIWFIVYALISGFAMNFLQAVYFKKAGFLASLSIRLGHYLLWHILLGVYVELAELS